MQEDIYLKDAVDRVLEVLRDTFGDYFKAYVNGIVDEPEASLLPAVMATTSSSEITAGATGTDDISEEIVIVVMLNQKDFMGANMQAASTDLHIAASDLELRRIVYAQDPNTSQYLDRTIMYALRRFLTLSGYIFNSRVSLDFTPVRRGEDLFTQEATITFKVNRMALVPIRN